MGAWDLEEREVETPCICTTERQKDQVEAGIIPMLASSRLIDRALQLARIDGRRNGRTQGISHGGDDDAGARTRASERDHA
jgi:hypothetical protein